VQIGLEGAEQQAESLIVEPRAALHQPVEHVLQRQVLAIVHGCPHAVEDRAHPGLLRPLRRVRLRALR